VSKPWRRLNINNTNAINTTINLKELSLAEFVKKRQQGTWTYDSTSIEEILNASWLQYMTTIGLNVVGALLLYKEPNCNQKSAHIDKLDSNELQYSVAINWAIGTDDGEMIWYKKPTIIPDRYDNLDGPYCHDFPQWAVGKLEEEDRKCIGNTPTLIRTDIPHNIKLSAHSRWAISVRFNFTNHLPANIYYSWDDVIARMQDYIKIEDIV
jgi:hypothetical protein